MSFPPSSDPSIHRLLRSRSGGCNGPLRTSYRPRRRRRHRSRSGDARRLCGGGLLSYWLNRKHTYESDRPHREATWRFALVALVGFLVTWFLMHAFTVWLDGPYLPSQIITTGVVMLWSFMAHKAWTFA
ncbi:GtrA family protein [Microvirga sp. RSM25]|uniref:GtrA family protein n=1 Tax=Microvirga sp. RSM25 TaxID=3273802 RepID=UPI00384AFDCB